MPNVTINIGGRAFQVACNDGEETYLQTAASMLDTEAAALVAHSGHIAESQMLLMAGLMLADRTAGLEDRVKILEQDLEKIAKASPSMPPETIQSLNGLTADLEALADRLEAKNG